MNSEIKDVYVDLDTVYADLDTSELDELLKAEEIKYYLFIENGIINGRGCCKRAEENILNCEVTEEIFNNFEKYVYQDGELVLNPNYEAEQEAKEQERIAKLNMTRGDFIEGLILAQGKDESDVLALIDSLEIDEVTKKVYKNRVKNALDFYRSYPLVDVLGDKLGLTKEQLDRFFETKNYNYLKAAEVVVNE